MEPQLNIAEDVERGEGDMFVLRRLADMEVSLAVIEPQEGITDAVILGKF
jgi:hypothetical protein